MSELTPEEVLYIRYQELGTMARDAEAERKKIRDEEINPLIEAGVVLGDATHCLVVENRLKTDFDWLAAVACGDIAPDVLKKHSKVTVTPILVSRKKDEDAREREREKNLIRAASADLLGIVERLARGEADDQLLADAADVAHQARTGEKP